MEWLSEITSNLLQLDYDRSRVQVLFVIFLALAAFSLTLALSLFGAIIFNPLKKRIVKAQQTTVAQTLPPKATGKDLLQQAGAFFVPKEEKKRSAIAYQLDTAGYRSPRSTAIFYGIKLLGFALTPLLILSGITLFTSRPPLDDLGIALAGGLLAFLLPNYALKRAVRKRKRNLQHALPDALDLMVVCAEAGLGLNAAIKRVAEEIGVQHPELADELQTVMMQTRAGMDNRTALKELERRTDLHDISAFVTTLLQAMRFGTSIGQSLRVFSDDMRDKRLQRAQEKAARLSLTMLMPIALCMLPLYFLILLGPSMISLLKAFGKISGG